MFERPFTVAAGSVLLLVVCLGARAQNSAARGAPPGHRAPTKNVAARVSLAPRFVPGESFRYGVVFNTTTAVSHTGLLSDPQGPSTEGVTWTATLRFDVLPAESGNSGVRLRLFYEKSGAEIRSDTFDPNAAQVEEQYKNLEGKMLELAFDSEGKVTGVTGLEGVVDSDAALQSARQWITQFVAGAGAPAGGVVIGQKWDTDQAADSLPLAGLVWRSASQYVRDEPCPADVSEGARSATPNSAPPGDMCAVVVADVNLIQPKLITNPTPQALLQSGMRTVGVWQGAAHSQSYISLRTGLVTNIAQKGTEAMDVTFTTEHQESLRYAGTIASQSQITLEPAAPSQ